MTNVGRQHLAHALVHAVRGVHTDQIGITLCANLTHHGALGLTTQEGNLGQIITLGHNTNDLFGIVGGGHGKGTNLGEIKFEKE